MHETPTTGLFSPPALLYLGIGLVTARILLEGKPTRGLKWLEWLQFLVKAASITLLWPLVLFLERYEAWLKEAQAPSSPALPPAGEGSEGQTADPKTTLTLSPSETAHDSQSH